MSPDPSSRIRASASWIALAVAFLPVLADLVNHFINVPHQRSFLLAPVLLLLCAWRGPAHVANPHRDAFLLLLAAVALQFVGIASQTVFISRFGLALAVVGMARWHGSPKFSVALLAFGAIPVPVAAIVYTTPWLESLWATAAAHFVQLLGGEVSASGPLFLSSAGRLELAPIDGGLPLLKVLVELAWYAAVRQGLPGRALLGRVALGAVLVGPIQLIGVTIAVSLLTFGFADMARVWLDHGLWLGVAAYVIWRVERRSH
jgi:hypothetical protein